MLQHRVGVEPDLLELLHQIAEHGALGAARGQRLLAQFILEIGLAIGADDDGLEFLVVIDAGDPVVGPQHVLIEQIADREIIRMVADRHHRDDLAPVQEQS